MMSNLTTRPAATVMLGLRRFAATLALTAFGLHGVASAQTPAAVDTPFNPPPGKTCRPWQDIARETNPARVNAAQTDAARRAAIQPEPTDADLETRMLKVHNDLRRALGVPDLTWDADLASGSKAWAKGLVAARTWLVHAPNVNEAIVGGEGDADWTVEEQANRWISERVEGFQNEPATHPSTRENPGYNLCWGSGHYQGMIRYATYTVGCGVATSADGLGRSLVCRYGNAPLPAGWVDRPYPTGPRSSWPARPPMTASAAETAAAEASPEASLGGETNSYRKSIGRPPLTWNTELAATAQARADSLIALPNPQSANNEADEYRGYGWSNTQAGAEPVYPASAATLRGSLDAWGRALHTNKPWTEMGCGTATRQLNGQNRRMVVCFYSPKS